MAKRRPDIYEYSKGEKYPVEGNVFKVQKKLKKETPKNIHEGHRERLRQRFLKEGLDNFQDHNVLELLLFYSIPVKDTNEEAHALINAFGSLSAVFDASYEELCCVKGIGERTASLIKLMPELFKKYETDKLNNEDVMLNSSKLVAKYVSKYFKGVTEEKLYLLCLDTNCKMISFELISEGTISEAPVNVRKIMEIAIRDKASNLILVHNHPSGVTAPSRQDADATVGIATLMEKVGLRLSDHIIIGHGDDFFSFRKSQKWSGIF